MSYFVNPFYDGVMLFMLQAPLPPKQTTGKTKNKQFERFLRMHLKTIQTLDKWPMKGKLLVSISVTGREKWVENCDIDNISKAVLDCLKGIVFLDDKQVYALMAEKRIDSNQDGIMVGIKEINDHNDYFGVNIPYYWLPSGEGLEYRNEPWWLIFGDKKMEQ